MARYAAFLRGVSPMNATMPQLKQAFEAAGFTEVKTVLSSGNVVFDARRASEVTLQRRAEAAIRDRLGQAFLTIVRPVDALREMLATDPYRDFGLSPSAKRIVTFLREAPSATVTLPVERDGAPPRPRRPRALQHLRAEPQGSGLHGAHRADVRQGAHDPHLGYRRQGRPRLARLASATAPSQPLFEPFRRGAAPRSSV